MPRRAEKTTEKHKVSGKLYPLNMRTTFELRRQLEAAAAQSGRSLAQEVERRLELSFHYEGQVRDLTARNRALEDDRHQQQQRMDTLFDIVTRERVKKPVGITTAEAAIIAASSREPEMRRLAEHVLVGRMQREQEGPEKPDARIRGGYALASDAEELEKAQDIMNRARALLERTKELVEERQKNKRGDAA